MGSTRTTNLAFLLVLVLLGCGRTLAQDNKQPLAQGNNTSSSSTANAANDSVPVEAPTVAPVAPPTPAAECPLNCVNGGVCKLGDQDNSFHPKEANGAPFTFLQTTNREGWYCDCPEGFTGLRCNRKYDVCPLVTTNPNIDAHICYHGGKCLNGLAVLSSSPVPSSQRFCDCSDAEHNGTPYFGKYCQAEAAVRCSDDSEQYCTAQGTCKEGFDTKVWPCDCPEGHRGAHCEYMRGSVPNCTLPCGEGTDGGGVGSCRLGIKDFTNARYEDFWATHDGNYQYCSCPDEWFGDSCEVPGIKCGKADCFNGGKCLESLNKNGQTTYACDCRDANYMGLNWSGQYCENSETSSCDSDELQHANGHLFCTNGGTCKDPSSPHLGCNCPSGYFGAACDQHKEEEAECSMNCQNGGGCRAGMKDNSLIKKLGLELEGYNNTHHTELFEHCVCPNNFFGIQCEHKLEICPGGDHVCLHGSECRANNEGGSTGELHYTCDCDTAFNSLDQYAGKFCQYTSTDICTNNGQPGIGKAKFAFCVNDGICKGKVNDGEDPPGCTCTEQFYGEHCEYLKQEEEEVLNDDGDYDGGYANDDYSDKATMEPVQVVQSSEFHLDRDGLIVGLSCALIVAVVVFMAIVAREFLKSRSLSSKAIDVNAALSEEETATSGIIYASGSGDDSLEDIEVDDYVNNHSNILTPNEMNDVQLV